MFPCFFALLLPSVLAASFSPQEQLLGGLPFVLFTKGGRFLSEEQVTCSGHDHVAEQYQTDSGAHLIEYSHCRVSRARGYQQRPSLIAAEGDEMQVPLADPPLQSFRHK